MLAIGSPFGLSQTVSAGIVSAKNRSIDDPGAGNIDRGQFQRFIQTDAAINPGNSGGPLVDMAGQVIGMNTAIYTQSAGSEGVGFAMPSNTLISVYNQLISPTTRSSAAPSASSSRPRSSSAVGRVYGFANGGVLVNTVTPNGPAAKAGIQARDVITSVDGKPIKNGDELVGNISARKVGSTVRLGICATASRSPSKSASPTAPSSSPNRRQRRSDDNAGPTQADIGQNKLGITVAARPPGRRQQTRHQGRRHRHQRPSRLLRGRDQPSQERRHRRDQPSPGHRRAELPRRGRPLKSGEDVVFVVRDPQGRTPATPTSAEPCPTSNRCQPFTPSDDESVVIDRGSSADWSHRYKAVILGLGVPSERSLLDGVIRRRISVFASR